MKRDRRIRGIATVLAAFDRTAASYLVKGHPGERGSPEIPNHFAVRAMMGPHAPLEALDHWPAAAARKLLISYMGLCPDVDIADAVKASRRQLAWLVEWERTSLIEYLIDGSTIAVLPWHDQLAGKP